MTTRYFGAPIERNGDPRLLRGRALFLDDVALPNMMHVAFLRSTVAHGRIRGIDAAAARRRAGGPASLPSMPRAISAAT
jgi:carbon-monoxide dehydrogenase large subunit